MVASIVLAAMPAHLAQVFLVTAVEPEYLRVPAGVRDRVEHLPKPYSYVDQARVKDRFSGYARPVRRAIGRANVGLRFLKNTSYVRRLVQLIRQHRIDLVHLNNGFENLEGHLAASMTGRPVLVHAHGSAGDSWPTRYLAPRVAGALGISTAVETSLAKAGVPSGRHWMLLNPLTVEPSPLTTEERADARRHHGIAASDVTVGIVGRVVRWKGQLEFIRAFAVAAATRPSTRALIIGEVTDNNDRYQGELQAEIVRLGIKDRVTFTGYLSDARRAYALLDVLVHSSIEPEPFGLVLTEAMVLGVPVIAADRGGPLEIVHDGEDGFLRNPLKTEDVASVIGTLVDRPDERARIGTTARDSVLERFDPSVYVTRLAAIYARLAPPDGTSR